MNSANEAALYAGFKEMLKRGELAYALKGLVRMKELHAASARFLCAVIRFKCFTKEQTSNPVLELLEEEVAHIPSEKQVMEQLEAASKDNLEMCYYCEGELT